MDVSDLPDSMQGSENGHFCFYFHSPAKVHYFTMYHGPSKCFKY